MTESLPSWWGIVDRIVVRNGPWIFQAVSHLRRIPPGTELTSEEIKFRMLDSGCPRPSHSNHWGALISHAIGRGLITETGEFRHWHRKRTGRGRMTAVYRRTRGI